jgi:transglutaminase-like putative cysteine protease
MMRWLATSLLAATLVSLVLWLGPRSARATGEFQADYDVQYAVSPTGKTIVTQQVRLVNKLANFYPKEYTLMLDSDKISNVIAYDDGGIITPSLSVKDGKTQIGLAFNVKAIGLGKSLTFSLRYEHGGVASKNGSIWEVYVPGVVNDADIGDYDVTLSVPPSFGPAAYLSPRPANGRSWTKEQMIRGGIAGAYGAAQNFDMTLTYTLTNDGVVSEIQDIAIPPSNAYQKITLTSLNPSPVTVISDRDGNWLARYRVSPREKLTVTAVLTASIYLAARKDYQTPPVEIADYLKDAKFWETKDEEIMQLGRTYDTPRKIYDYVASTLHYDYDKVNETPARMGAKEVLKQKNKAVCMEFTDLFIALARASGIPARRVVGYAYTNNPKLRPLSLVSDVLHAWPEYYDEELKVWVPIDPTWANTTGGVDYFTKLDFNHIAFAVNGMDSSLPYPAGYYRSEGSSGRDVRVEFAASPKDKGASVATVIEFPEQVGAGTKVSGAIVITNKGGESAYNISVNAFSEPGDIKVTEIIPELLPYAVVRIPISTVFGHTVQTRPGQIRARVNDVTVTHSFRIQPLYWLIVLGSATMLLALLVAFRLLRLLLWKRFRKH